VNVNLNEYLFAVIDTDRDAPDPANTRSSVRVHGTAFAIGNGLFLTAHHVAIEALSKLMEDTPCQVRPESALPYARPVIEEALQEALFTLSDPGTQKALRDAPSELDTFVPDQDVPHDPSARALEYLRRRGLRATVRMGR
jgi:hypothetical protein